MYSRQASAEYFQMTEGFIMKENVAEDGAVE
jgi:hypothetical protein